jgi:hypothetical protein
MLLDVESGGICRAEIASPYESTQVRVLRGVGAVHGKARDGIRMAIEVGQRPSNVDISEFGNFSADLTVAMCKDCGPADTDTGVFEFGAPSFDAVELHATQDGKAGDTSCNDRDIDG